MTRIYGSIAVKNSPLYVRRVLSADHAPAAGKTVRGKPRISEVQSLRRSRPRDEMKPLEVEVDKTDSEGAQ